LIPLHNSTSAEPPEQRMLLLTEKRGEPSESLILTVRKMLDMISCLINGHRTIRLSPEKSILWHGYYIQQTETRRWSYLRLSQPGTSSALQPACNFLTTSGVTPLINILVSEDFRSKRGCNLIFTSSNSAAHDLLGNSNEE
jgi:hypothetical protein